MEISARKFQVASATNSTIPLPTNAKIAQPASLLVKLKQVVSQLVSKLNWIATKKVRFKKTKKNATSAKLVQLQLNL